MWPGVPENGKENRLGEFLQRLLLREENKWECVN
jgi:hypothetical protein